MVKKLVTSNLPSLAFEGFIRSQNKNNLSNPERAFLENPLFVLWRTLIMDLADPGTFSGIFLINDTFIMLQKNVFDQKNV